MNRTSENLPVGNGVAGRTGPVNEQEFDQYAPTRPAFVPRDAAVPPLRESIDPENPWLGLASFTEETRSYFHGRDEEVGELCRRIQRKLLTVLFGQSGLGKTSILRAGVVPRLRAEGYCPVYVRLDYGRESPPPSEQIKQAVIRATAEIGSWTRPGVAVSGESLWEFLHHRDDTLRDAAGRTLTPLLIFDQFEEIFTLAQGDDFGRHRAAEFKEDLADLVENRAPKALEAKLERDDAAAERFDFARADYRILLALREDYLAHLEGLKVAMPSVTQNRMRLARMTGTQALAAVTGPGGRLVSDEVARSIVRFVAGGAELERAEVEPSLLSLVCRELNNARLAAGHAEISADLLAGSRETILSEFYERALADQPQGVRVFIEDELLTDSGYRESIAEERVRKGFLAAGAPAEALATLVDRRLLRVEERLDVRRVELTHDVLCGVVKASRDVRHEREAKEAAERLLRDTRAREAAAQQALWRSRIVAAICGVLACAAIASAGYAYSNLRRVRVSEAAAQRAAAEAQAAAIKTRAAEMMAAQARGQAEQLLTYVIDDLWENLEPLGRLDLVRELSTRVIDYYEGLPDMLRNTEARRGLATTLAQRAIIIGIQGDLKASDADLNRATSLLEELRPAEAANVAFMAADALTNSGQARNLYQRQMFHDAAVAAGRAADIALRISKVPNVSRIYRNLRPTFLAKYGFYLMRDNRVAEAMQASMAALEDYRSLGVPRDDDVLLTARYAEDLVWAAEIAVDLGQLDQSEKLATEGQSIARAVLTRSPGDQRARRTLALAAGRLYSVAYRRADVAGALEHAQTSRKEYETLLAIDPTNSVTRNNLAVAFRAEASSLLRLGRRSEGERAFEAAARDEPGALITGSRAGVVMTANYELADWYERTGEPLKSAAHLKEARRLRVISEKDKASDSTEALLNNEWPVELERRNTLSSGKLEETIAASRGSLQAIAAVKPANVGQEDTLRSIRFGADAHIAEACVLLQRWPEAAAAAREALASGFNAVRYGVSATTELQRMHVCLAAGLARQNRRAEAAQAVEPALAYFRPLARRLPEDFTTQMSTTFALIVAAEAESPGAARQALLREAHQSFDSMASYRKSPERQRLGVWLAGLDQGQ